MMHLAQIRIVSLAVLVIFLGIVVRSHSIAQTQKIRIAYSSRSNTITPLYVSVSKGFFLEEGLEVELIQLSPRLGAMAVMNCDVSFTTYLCQHLSRHSAGTALEGHSDCNAIEIVRPGPFIEAGLPCRSPKSQNLHTESYITNCHAQVDACGLGLIDEEGLCLFYPFSKIRFDASKGAKREEKLFLVGGLSVFLLDDVSTPWVVCR